MTIHKHVLAFFRPSAWIRLALGFAIAAVTASCGHAPGMSIDRESESLKARADILTVDHVLVQKLAEERRAARSPVQRPPEFRVETGAYEYRIAPQDMLRVTVWNQPELTNPSGTTTELSGRLVNADGRMFFPHIGWIGVSGRSVAEVRDMIASGLARVLRNPQVDVSVLQYRGQRVYMSGEVRAPGSLAITDVPPDLTEMVARAGGATAEADLTNVTITRASRTVSVDLQALYYGGDLSSNLRLQHGDVVHLPERRAARVFVTGEVTRPAALPMPRGDMSLADALGDAGGVNPLSANAGQIFVIRGSGRPQVYHLNAAGPEALLLADRFILQARDVVYVDAAPVVRWSRLVSNILPSASLLRETWSTSVRVP